MLAMITSITRVYEAPPGGVGVYRVWVAFHNHGRATFTQPFAVPPRCGQTWDMPEPRLDILRAHPDGSPR